MFYRQLKIGYAMVQVVVKILVTDLSNGDSTMSHRLRMAINHQLLAK